jgi:hypothetical protein
MDTGPVYPLIAEFVSDADNDTNPDFTSCSPFWVVCIFPLALPLTFSRSSMASVEALPGAGAGLRDPGKIVITDDCIAMTITSNKEQHIKSLNASLVQTSHNYIVDVLPGDWVMAWILNHEEKGRDVAKRANQGQACNNFDDGLKFVGRVNSIRKRLERDPDGGLTSTFSLSAAAFTELDSQFFYDQSLADTTFAGAAGLSTWLAMVGMDVEQLLQISIDSQADNVHKIIPTLIELLLGKGVPSTVNPVKELPAATGAGVGSQEEAPFAYLVPKEVGDLLGKTSRDVSKAGGVLAYCDILTTIYGVQHFSNTLSTSSPYRVFIPDISEGDGSSFQFTGKSMMGAFIPIMPQLTNRPLWNVLTQYLNPTVNEMYTCLRVNAAGKIVPTLMLRQIPFTTDAFVQKNENIPVTAFLSLPRWKMHSGLLSVVDVGRSDATRCNFVHVYGQNNYATNNISVTEQLVNNPPIRDDLDIQRSGLRTYMTTVAVDAFDQAGRAPREWIEFIADMMIGSQYTLNGSMACRGISAPICEGDNLEFDNVAYHIEGVTHSVMIEPDGGRNFTTMLQLSNGMRIAAKKGQKLTDQSDVSNTPQYPGFEQDDNTQYDPGFTQDDGKTIEEQ